MDLMQQWRNGTLALVHLAKSYKTLNITQRKSSTGRNIIQGIRQQVSADPGRYQEHIWKGNQIHQTRPSKENYDSNYYEGTTSHHTNRCYGHSPSDQESRKNDSLGSRKQVPNLNQDNQDRLGRENTPSYNQHGNLGRIRDEPFQTRPSQMLQMSEI